jgi:predicted dehydrogenase
MDKVRVGFIGVGGIASVHLKNINQNDNAEITAVCDVVEEIAHNRGSEYGVSAYTDYNEMLENEELDALFVCIPPFAHGDIEEKAARKGIHLMIEKPLGLDIEEVHKKAEVIKDSGIINASGYCLRYLDTVAKAKEYLKDKKIAMVRGHHIGSFVKTPWYRVQSQSGGQLVEQSTHSLDMIRYLGGEINNVYANMSLQVMGDIENIDIPDVTSVNFTFETGAVGHLDSSFTQPDGRTGVEILGRNFRVVIDGTTLSIVEKEQTTVYKSKVNFYEEQDRTFIEAVRSGNQEIILASYEDGLKTLAVTLAANLSQQSGEPVKLSSFEQSIPSA